MLEKILNAWCEENGAARSSVAAQKIASALVAWYEQDATARSRAQFENADAQPSPEIERLLRRINECPLNCGSETIGAEARRPEQQNRSAIHWSFLTRLAVRSAMTVSGSIVNLRTSARAAWWNMGGWDIENSLHAFWSNADNADRLIVWFGQHSAREFAFRLA
ncbi:hypothetical protein GB928_025745 [Shinella curvata]|uniref:Uncharacterized protein n=1 Tax=Shinella curvata TaxID=1817964 RepID=A0ABT8XN64_9HYPH|nr:hypothetical protein [Shinella curvata]MCJ8056991.1 hypothetical protein [Shinella curvata]MDO6124595.1 hypothetical protein [Shinella curvata]